MDRTIETYRNPRKTNWEGYKADLARGLAGVAVTVKSNKDVELAAEQIQNAIISAYENNCPLVTRKSTRNVPWWNKDLDTMRRQVRKKFNNAKTSANWDDYRTSLTEYNRALRKAKREAWKRHCESIESISECSRLQKILSKDNRCTINSLLTETGQYTKTGKETMEELLLVHFPGSTVIDQTPEEWLESELEATGNRATRADWTVSKKVIDQSKIRWAINSFEPYKSPGNDGIWPIMLQQGIDLLATKLCTLYRASLALGYIPKIWKPVRVVFIAKAGRNSYTQAKSLRPYKSYVIST